MSPEPAKDISEIEHKVMLWKGDIRNLQEGGGDDRAMLENNDQMITILIGMMPENVADHLISKYEAGVSTLDDVEKCLEDYLIKVRNKGADKKRSDKAAQVTGFGEPVAGTPLGVASTPSGVAETEVREEWSEEFDGIWPLLALHCRASSQTSKGRRGRTARGKP